MRRIGYLLAGTAFAILAPAAASAQEATAQAVAEASTNDEIVVTARKREERLQDVPIAVSAVSGAALEREQINLIKDVAAIVPGLNINSDGVGRSFISIRGVGTTLIDTVQPGVGIFIDGIYQPNTSYLNSPVVDVERIEVLKGPQGTLFGNNTLGGAINVITRAPTDDFHGRLVANYAGPDNYQTYAGTVSGPIVEGALRGRLAASYHIQDGFSTNTLAGGDARPLETTSVNGSLLWDAPQGAQISLNAYYNRVSGSLTTYGSPSGPTNYVDDVQTNVNSLATYDYTGVNLRGVFNVTDNTQMTAILAYDHKEGKANGDGDFGPVDFLRVRDGRNKRETFTGEVRFDTKWSERFSTLIGVFADNSETTDRFLRDIFVTLPGPPPVTLLAGTIPSAQRDELSTQAIFGTAFFNITDRLEFSAGLRADHQEVATTASPSVYSADEIEPRFTLTQKWTPNHMTYVSVARGFRGGGANSAGAPNPIYQGDSVWTYELGNKFTSDDRKLTLNTALYYNDYSHYIGQNSLTPTLIAVNLNTGDVSSYGAEVEGIWRPTDILQIAGGLTYNHSRVTDDSEYRAVIGSGLATDRILFQPDWNAYVSPSLVFPIGDDDAITVDATVSYKGERTGSSLSPTFTPVLDSYTLVNGNLAYEHANFTIALWGTNLTDEQYYESYLDSSLLSALGLTGPLVHNLGITGDRRRIGVRLSAKF